jgi:acetaldehyde dehydrogenase (acetylating)
MTSFDNVNMVTCGGQASIPIAWALGKVYGANLSYVEVVSSIASKSAGPATRRNLDEYITTTEKGLALFSGCENTKAILNLNPALPCVDMQTTVLAKLGFVGFGADADLQSLTKLVADVAADVKEYVPGYEVIVAPTFESGRIIIMVRVKGLGDYLPAYAGNLDIINCAAIAMAEEYAAVVAARSEP